MLFVIVGVLVDDIVGVLELVVLDVCETETVVVLELVVLDVCETETVDVFDPDELSDIELDIVNKLEAVFETLGVSLFVILILEVSEGNGLVDKILDRILQTEDNKLHREAIEDLEELGGLDKASEIMNWDSSQKQNWLRAINQAIQIHNNK